VDVISLFETLATPGHQLAQQAHLDLAIHGHPRLRLRISLCRTRISTSLPHAQGVGTEVGWCRTHISCPR